MKKNILLMAFSMVAMLMLIPCEGYANDSSVSIESYVYQDDRGKKVDLTDAEKYALKKPAKRAAGKGISRNETNAEMKARTAARGKFAENIRAAVVSATKTIFHESNSYVEDEIIEGEEENYSSGTHTEGGEKSSSMLKSVANEVIQNTTVVKTDKFYNNKRHRYTIYVCLEYNGDVKELVEQTVKKIRQRVPQDARKRIEENMEKFEFEIEQELNKDKSNNNDSNNESDED